MNKLIEIIKKFPIIFGIILTLLLDKITDLPIQDLFTGFMSYQTAFLLHISLIQVSAGLLSILILKKLKLNNCFNLFSKINVTKKSHGFFLLLAFMSIIIIINMISLPYDEIFKNPAGNLFLYFLAFMSTGFYEELVSRALVFNVINNKYGKTRKGFFLSIFAANLIFGGTHIVWYFMGLYPLSTSLNQIMYAFLIGVFFSALYLKYDSLLIPMVFHGLIDVTGCTSFLKITSKELYNASLVQSPVGIEDFIASLIIFLPFFLIGLFMLRNVGPQKRRAMNVEAAQ